MAIILENIKNRDNVRIKEKYRYFDYNDYAIGQVGSLLIDFLTDQVNSGIITNKNKNSVLKTIGINEDVLNEYNLNHLNSDNLKELLINIEYDEYIFKNTNLIDNGDFKVSPKDKLKYLETLSNIIKDFYGKDDNKKIYPHTLVKEIFSIYEITTKDFENFLDFNTFIDNSLSNSYEKEFLKYIEDNLIFTTINANSPKYDVNNIKIDTKKYQLNMYELKQMFPILLDGQNLVWDKKDDLSMSSSLLDLDNIDFNKTIIFLINNTLSDKSNVITYQYLNNSFDLNKIVNTKNEYNIISILIIKSLIEINAIGEYMENNIKSNSYKNSLNGEFKKLQKIYSDGGSEFELNEKYKQIKENIAIIMNDFRQENSSIEIEINKDNEKRSYSFDSNYFQVKTILSAYSKQNGLSMLLPGPPDFGKSYSTEELIKLFGGTIVKQEHILSLSALVGTFEKRPASFDPNKRTHPLTELKSSVINGEYSDGIIHMEEGARTFMELLSSKVNSPDESALLSILEPMSRNNKYWKAEAYGKNIKLFPAEHIKFVWSTNYIPKDLSNELQVRFTSIPMDFSTITNYNSLNKIVNSMLYKYNVEKEINNFANEDNSLKFINTIQEVNNKTNALLKEYGFDKIYNQYRSSKNRDYNDYKKNLSDINIDKLKEFMLDNRIDLFLIFKLKDELSNVQNGIKEYLDIIGNNDIENINDGVKYLRLKTMLDLVNKEYNTSFNIKDLYNKYGLTIDSIIKPFNEIGIDIDNALEKYHSLDAYFMGAINQFSYLSDIKNSLLKSNSMVNDSNILLLTVGEYIKDKIDINYINKDLDESNSIIYKSKQVKDNYISLVSEYNNIIYNDYKKIEDGYSKTQAIVPFKSSDAPIIGFEKIIKSINGLSDSFTIDKELYKIMSSGTNINILNSILEKNGFNVLEGNNYILGGNR